MAGEPYMPRRILNVTATLFVLAAGAAGGSARAAEADRAMHVSMPLGLSVPAPSGFLEFCRRTPEQCQSSTTEGRNPAAAARHASQLYWRNVFARGAAPGPASNGVRVQSAAPSSNTPLPRSAGRDAYDRPYGLPTVGSPGRPDVVIAPRLQPAMTGGPHRPSATEAGDQQAETPVADGASHASDFAASSNPSAQSIAQIGGVPGAGSPELTSTQAVPGFAEADQPSPPAALSANDLESARPAADTVLALTPETWALLNTVNRRVNYSIRKASDQSTFGKADYWQSPTRDGAPGDCEDYVLAKRQALIASGVPAATLSIAIVQTRWGESHAVLLVIGDTGEVVLDSLSPAILRWDLAPYTWRERQAPGQVFEWMTIPAPGLPSRASQITAAS